MKIENVCLSVVACVLSCLVAQADPVKLLRSSTTAFSAGTDWSDGNPPNSSKDYLVDSSYVLTCDYDRTFAGKSLQFGVVGGTEGVFYKLHQGTLTFSKLIFAKGYYRTWMSNAGEYCKINGPIEVLSPANAPFGFYSTHNGGPVGYAAYLNGNVSGAEGTGLLFGYYPEAKQQTALAESKNYLNGDNSDYCGQLTFMGVNMTHFFAQNTSLGGALNAMKYDAVVLKENTTLQSNGDNLTLAANLNRGLSVDSTGGRLAVADGNALRLEWPISGSGTLRKTGAGTLTLAGAVNPAAAGATGAGFEVAEGQVVLDAGFSNVSGHSLTVDAGATLTVAPGEEITVNSLVFNGGAFAITCEVSNSETNSGVLVLGEGCQPNWPLPVYPHAVRGVKVPFLKVPTSVGTITPASFTTPGDFPATALPSARFTVETADDVQTAYAETLPIVYVATTQAFLAERSGNEKNWSDNRQVHAGADYFADTTLNPDVTGNRALASSDLGGTDYTLPFESLTLRGDGAYRKANLGASTTYPFNTHSLTGDIRTYDHAKFHPSVASGQTEWNLCGKLYVGNVQTSGDVGLAVYPCSSGLYDFKSDISGSGAIAFSLPANGVEPIVSFTGKNLHNGTLFFYNKNEQPDSSLTFRFTAESFGVDLPTYRERAVILQMGGKGFTLHPFGSQRIAFENRGFVYLSGAANVEVDEDCDFELAAPFKFLADLTIRKIGGGVWAMGKQMANDSGKIGTVKVVEGYLRAETARAFSNVKVEIDAGAGLAAKYVPGATGEAAEYGMIVTDAAKLTVAGDTLAFKVTTDGADMRRVSVPVLTVPADLASVIDAKKIVVSHDTSLSPEVVRENVTIDNNACVRYSCKFKSGILLIVR